MTDKARKDAISLIRQYYERFNSGDIEGFLSLLTEDVIHDLSQGPRETGKPAFRKFLEHMNRCYQERVRDLVVMVDETGRRAAAEFQLDGKYIATDGDLPPARGQTYVLTVGAFFEIRNGKVARISNTYNFKDWLRQVQG
ncbi:MAG TPA: ketosteroid isomerase-related protein [Alphaproteobacteria bacterium]|nr:ketosteroid isomerase-related protein [Alphaproteobacteria bacterium]